MDIESMFTSVLRLWIWLNTRKQMEIDLSPIRSFEGPWTLKVLRNLCIALNCDSKRCSLKPSKDSFEVEINNDNEPLLLLHLYYIGSIGWCALRFAMCPVHMCVYWSKGQTFVPLNNNNSRLPSLHLLHGACWNAKRRILFEKFHKQADINWQL